MAIFRQFALLPPRIRVPHPGPPLPRAGGWGRVVRGVPRGSRQRGPDRGKGDPRRRGPDSGIVCYHRALSHRWGSVVDGRSCRSAAASWVDKPTGVCGAPHISRSSELATLTHSLVERPPSVSVLEGTCVTRASRPRGSRSPQPWHHDSRGAPRYQSVW